MNCNRLPLVFENVCNVCVVVEHSSLTGRCETEFDGIVIQSGIGVFGLVPHTLATLIQGKFLHYFPSVVLFRHFK